MKVYGSYTDKDYIAFLMKPVAECNLYDFLSRPGGLKDRERHDIRNFYGCLASAVNYLHGCNIRHRDLSSRNILIHQGIVFISDLGSAYKWADSASRGSVTQDRDVPRSFEYMAPEVARKTPRSSSSDMWSLGVVFLEMTTLLVGRSLDKLQAAIERNARSHNLEPYIWANPRVVNTWVAELQQSNKGPQHDNEPLVWIRDLLNENPNNRPKSRGLMQDILESASFNIFCCIECQQEYRDRRFQYPSTQTIPEETIEDSTDVRNNVASLFQDEDPHTIPVSVKQSSSIETWLADTGENSVQSEPPPMPGKFSFDDYYEGTVEERYRYPEATLAPSSMDDRASRLGISPVPPLPAFENADETLSPLISPTPIEFTGVTKFYPQISTAQPHTTYFVPPGLARDTGLGFLEYDSPSSSDDEEPKLFNEMEDSSGSETDSDATIIPSKADTSETSGTDGKASDLKWTLPDFRGEENRWIRTLDTLPEDQEDKYSKADLITNTEPENLELPQDHEEENDDVAQSSFKRKDIGSKDAKDAKATLTEDDTNRKIHADDNPTRGNSQGDMLTKYDEPEKNTQDAAGKITDSVVKSNTKKAVTFAVSDDIELEGKDSIKTMLSSSSNPVQGSEEEMTKLPEHPDKSKVAIQMPKQKGKQHSQSKKAVEKGSQQREPLPAKEQPDGVESTGPSSVPEDPPDPPVSSYRDPPDNAKDTPKVSKATKILSKPKPASQMDGLSKGKLRLQKSPTGFEGGSGKLSMANIATWNDSFSGPKSFQRKKREPIPGMSPSGYIEDTWESASSVATSVTSERTSKLLQGFNFDKWFDRDHKLLEKFCAQGKVAAVRVLLDKGCNPGKANPSKDGRRPGPITKAIQGASEKHNKCVRELIKHAVDVNVRSTRSGKTPLHVAIENPNFKGYVPLIRDLIEAGADTNKKDLKDDYPIMKVFYGNDAGPLEDYRRRTLALLLRNTDTEVNIVLPGTLNTPLHLAVRRKDIYAVGMLLYKKADVNAKNASGTTLLLLTANQFQGPLANDHTILLKLLLETTGLAVDEKTGFNEQTALHQAVRSGTSAAVDLLMEHGASPYCKDSQGNDASAIAIQNAPSHLLEEHVDIMIQLRDSMEKSWPLEDNICVLEQACKDPDIALMKTLLDEGLDPKCMKNKRPILQRAIGYGNQAVVELLTQKGAVVDARNENGLDAITYAVQKDEEKIATYLVREGRYQKKGAARMTMDTLKDLIAKRKDKKPDK